MLPLVIRTLRSYGRTAARGRGWRKSIPFRSVVGCPRSKFIPVSFQIRGIKATHFTNEFWGVIGSILLTSDRRICYPQWQFLSCDEAHFAPGFHDFFEAPD